MIDFHCHLDLYPDPPAVLQRAVEKGVYLLAITTTPLAWHATLNLVSSCKRVRAAVGLHPELVGERFHEVSLLERLIGETRYVGEVGLDGSPAYRGSFAKQDDVLRRVLKECARLHGRVLSIHSRSAVSGVLDALSSTPNAGIPILHWFSGSLRDVQRAIELGCWFSVGPAMLASAKGRHLTEAMPSDRVLTETDAPFTSSGRSAPLMPWDVSKAERQLSEIWQMTASQVHEKLLSNLRRLVENSAAMAVRSTADITTPSEHPAAQRPAG